MDRERSTKIKIGENEYSLVLTTKATKEIAARYGGLENLGDKLMKSENFEMAMRLSGLLLSLPIKVFSFTTSKIPMIKNRCLQRTRSSF